MAIIMPSARSGRSGVEIMQAFFRELGLGQAAAALFTLKEAIALLPADHPVPTWRLVGIQTMAP